MESPRVIKNMVFFICIAAMAFIVIGIIYYRSVYALYFAIGVILTSSLNVGKVFLLQRTVQKTLEKDDINSGKNYVRLQFLLRYALTTAVLLASGLISVYVDPPFISIWGAIAGLFTLQISVLIVRHRKLEDETR